MQTKTRTVRSTTGALKVCLGAAVVVVATGCGSPASSTDGSTVASTTPVSPTTSTPPGLPTQDTVTRELAKLNLGNGASVARTPNGYDGMVTGINADAGKVSFWHYATSWQQVGTSTYPFDPSVTSHPLDEKFTAPQVLEGMTHPIFILHGSFSGDSTANAIAYTDGPNGWGVVKAQRDGNLASSGEGVSYGGTGLENGAYFSGGLYETAECSKTLPFALCSGAQRVLKYWGWNGQKLTLVRTGGLPQ